MDLRPAVNGDWRGWDGLESVFYDSASRPVQDPTGPINPDSDTLLPVTAKPRNLNAIEKATSGGAYVESRRVWLLPVQPLPGTFRAKPADVIERKDGSRWTVLAAQLNNYETFWRLETINLSLAYQLDDTVNVERAALSYDAAGAAVKAFPSGPPPNGGIQLYGNLSAKVQLVTDEIREERGIRGFVGNYTIIVGRQIACTNEDRVTWTDAGGVFRIFDIKGVHNPDRIDELPVLDVELRP